MRREEIIFILGHVVQVDILDAGGAVRSIPELVEIEEASVW
jgi:hypothetical protein